jgi:thiol-disulfide isomerase/thioredoxin
VRPKLLRGAAALGLAAALLAAGLAGLTWYTRLAGPRGAPTAPDPIYALSFPDADGQQQALSQWRGKILVVNFWATWCAPCVAEMPELERLQAEYAGRGVAIVCLGTESGERVRKFRDQLGLRLVLLAGGFDAIAIARNLGDQQGVLPYTAVFSTDGTLLRTQLGALRPGQLRDWLNAALAAKPLAT